MRPLGAALEFGMELRGHEPRMVLELDDLDDPGELDDRALEPEAKPEIRHAMVAGKVGGEDLALDAAVAEAAGDDDAGRAVEPLVEVVVGQGLGVDPADLRVDAVGPGRVAKG